MAFNPLRHNAINSPAAGSDRHTNITFLGSSPFDTVSTRVIVVTMRSKKLQQAPENVVAVLGSGQFLRDDFVAMDVLLACTAKQTFRQHYCVPQFIRLVAELHTALQHF